MCKFPTLTEDTIFLNVTGYNKPLLDIVRKKKGRKKAIRLSKPTFDLNPAVREHK